MKNKLFTLLVLLSALTLSSCIHPYRPTTNQGNYISPEKIQQLKVGMSKDAVIELLGNPLLKNPTAQNRLIYIQTIQSGFGPMTETRINLDFNAQNKLIKVPKLEKK